MSWFDDLFDFGSDEASTVVDEVVPESSDWSLSDLWGDGWGEELIDSSGSSGDIDTSWFSDPTASLSTDNSSDYLGDFLKNLGVDSTPATDYGVTEGMDSNPVATSQLWEKLNTSTDPVFSPALDEGRSSAAMLSALTDRSSGYSPNDWGSSFGAGLSTDSGYSPESVYDTGSGSTFGASTGLNLGSGLDTGVKFDLGQAGSTASWLTKLLGKSKGQKSNLSKGIGALAMLSQMAGAFDSGKGSQAPTVSQKRTTPMSWNKSVASSGKAMKRGGDVQMGTGKPGPLGLLAGASGGQDDVVPIDASHGEYIFDADSVAALGDGNTDAGARKLDHMRQRIRAHKRSAPASKIPPKAKDPMKYLKGAN